MDIDWEQLATAAIRAHDALVHIDRRQIDPAWRSIYRDLRQAYQHRCDLTEPTSLDVRRILGK